MRSLQSQVYNLLVKEKLEIIIPVYRSTDYQHLLESLKFELSKCKEVLPWYRIMVISQGLNDEKERELESYLATLNPKTLKYLKFQSKEGVQELFKFAVSKSAGQWILFTEVHCKDFDMVRELINGSILSYTKDLLIFGWVPYHYCEENNLYGMGKLPLKKIQSTAPHYVVLNKDHYANNQFLKVLSRIRRGKYPIGDDRYNVQMFTHPIIIKEEPIGLSAKIDRIENPVMFDALTESEKRYIPEITKINKENVSKLTALVMSVWGRLDLVKRSVESIYENRNLDYPHRLIVVDDGSRKEVKVALQEFKDQGKIDHLILLPKHTGKKGKPALNTGLRWVQENLWQDITHIGIIDSDFEIRNPLWLGACIEGLERIKSYEKYKVRVIAVNGGNTVHKTIFTFIDRDFSIDVKEVIQGGQYIYERDHFDEVDKTMMYSTEPKKDSDWALWKRHVTSGYHVGHVVQAFSILTHDFMKHIGAGIRSWDKRKELT